MKTWTMKAKDSPRRRDILIVTALTGATLNCWSQVPPEVAGQLRSLRSRAQESASLMKAHFSDSATEYIVTRKLYMVARSEVEGLLGFMKQAILNGSLGTAQANAHLAQAVANARASAQAFFKYVDENTPAAAAKPGPVAIAAIGEAVKVVLDVLNAWGAAGEVRASITDARRKEAADLERELAWTAWAELSAQK